MTTTEPLNLTAVESILESDVHDVELGRIARDLIPALTERVRELEKDVERRKIRNTLARMRDPEGNEPETITAWRDCVIGWKERAGTAEIQAEDAKAAIGRVKVLADELWAHGAAAPSPAARDAALRIAAALEGGDI